jgi:hypothetical protein
VDAGFYVTGEEDFHHLNPHLGILISKIFLVNFVKDKTKINLKIYNKIKYNVPSCFFDSAHVGSLPRRIMTASITFSTCAGGLPYDLISVMSFLFNESKA